METYKELKVRHQKEIEALPLGFAFSNEQFEEMKEKLGVKDNSELYRFGSTGGFYRKADKELIFGTFDRQEQELQDAIFTPSGINTAYAVEMFEHEMFEHEYICNWDGDEDVLSACHLTEKQLDEHPELRKAYRKALGRYMRYADEHGWF